MRNAYYQLINYINMSQTQDVFYYAAKTILEHLQEIPNLSITQVSDMCFASTATISRLIRRLNYASFNDFKQDVIYSMEELRSEEAMHYANEPVKDFPHVDYEQMRNEFYDSIVDNLQYTQALFKTSDIEEIVNDIDEARNVVFLGFNFSQMVSSQLRSTLAAYNKPSSAKANEQLQLSCLREVSQDDLIILTTITGNYFRFKPEIVALFKTSPAKKIVITQASDLAKAYNVDKIIQVGNSNSSYIGKFSVMMVYEMIEMFFEAKHKNQLKNID